MRRLSAAITAALLVAVPLTLAPVASLPGPRPTPVAPHLEHVPLELQTPDVTANAVRTTAAAVLTVSRRVRHSFSTVGVTWAHSGTRSDATAAPASIQVSVRAHHQDGWGAWTQLDLQDGEQRPAPGAALRDGTEPAFVGTSDGVEVLLTVTRGKVPSGVRVDLVDPGTSDYDAHANDAPAATASAMASQPTILPRSAWGADESRVKAPPTYLSTIRAGVLHHTADTNSYTAAQVPAIIRGDYAYHLSRGWNDIGYNFLFDRFGRTWEGRAGGITRAVLGAHAGGFNTDTFGAAVIGNYETATPNSATLTAIARLFAWKLDPYHRDPLGTLQLTSSGGGTSRYPAGATVTKPVVMGHRDVGYTACPGGNLYAKLPALRRSIEAYMRPALISVGGPPATAAYGAGASMTARVLGTQSWRLTVRKACRSGVVVGSTGGTASDRASFRAVWNGRGPGSTVSRPGEYTMTLTGSNASGSSRPATGRVVVVPPVPAAIAAGSVSSGAGKYVALPPRRMLNTLGGSVMPAAPNARVDLPVLGHYSVPSSGVTSVVLQVTAICPTAGTAVSVWPAGQPQSGTGSVFVTPGFVRSALVTVPVGTDGKVSLSTSQGVTDLMVDILGYHTTGTAAPLLPVSSTRVFDSNTAGGALQPGVDRVVTLPTIAGVAPSQVVAVVANITVPRAAGDGGLAAYAYNSPYPGPAVLNYRGVYTTDGSTVIGVNQGKFVVRVAGSAVRATVDVVGLYVTSSLSGSTYSTMTNKRLLDTRSGAAFTAGQTRSLVVAGGSTGVPADADAVLVNLIAIPGATGTSFSAWAAGGTAPSSVQLQARAAAVSANLALVKVGAGGAISLRNTAGTAHLLVDVVGYYR